MKNKIFIFTKILYICILGGIIPLIALIKLAPDFSFTMYFAITYVVVILFSLFYIPIITFKNSRKVKKDYLKQCIKQFFFCLLVMIIFNTILDFILNKFDFLHVLIESSACAFGLSFIDIIFLKKDNMH